MFTQMLPAMIKYLTINKIDLKKYLVLALLVITFSATAQTIKLDYIPHGLIVKFDFKNLTLYTDTSSLFSIENNPQYSLDKTYEQRIRNLINKNSENDTAIFIGSFIPFNDSVQNPLETDWRVVLSLRQLTRENKIIIIDSHGAILR